MDLESIIFGLKETIKEKDAEIARLTEENGYLDGCAKQFLADYQKCEVERAELQKQVDELKGYIDFKTANVMCEKCKQQAVKDTAKEIFSELLKGENVCEEVVKDYYGGDYIMSAVTIDKIREIAKEHYGVEVE